MFREPDPRARTKDTLAEEYPKRRSAAPVILLYAREVSRIALLLELIVGVAAAASIDWPAVERLSASGANERALELVRAADPKRLSPSDALRAVATEQRLLHTLTRYADAQDAARRWIELATASGDRRRMAEAEHGAGLSYVAQHKHEPAAGHFQRALAHLEALKDEGLRLRVLLSAAQSQVSLARYVEAAALLDRAEGLWKASENDPANGSRLHRLRALLAIYRGDAAEAMPLIEEAVALARKSGDAGLVRGSLVLLGQTHVSLHQYSEALVWFRLVLQQKPDPQERANTLASIGISEFELNRMEEARKTFEEARRAAVELGSARIEAWAIGELGLVAWRHDKDAAGAIERFDESVRRFDRSKDARNAMIFLENKGVVYRDQGRFEDALRVFREVERRAAQIPGQQPTPNLHKSMGQSLAGLRRFDEAEKYLNLAIERARATGDGKRVWQGHHELARMYRARKQKDRAGESYRAALGEIESMRSRLRLDAFKADFFEDKVKVYEEYIAFTLNETPDADRVERAFAIAERARARSFLDSLAESRAAVHETLPAGLLRSEGALLAEISGLQARIRRGENTPEIRGALADSEKRLEAWNLRIRNENPRFREIRYPQPVDYAALRKALRPGELTIEYFLGDEGSHAWAASADRLQHFSLPPRAELERTLRAAYAQLLRPGPAVPAMDDLASVLLGPAAGGGAVRSLVIVPSGLLYYFPFEALPGVVQRFRVSYSPSASMLVEARNRAGTAAGGPLLALADPSRGGRRAVERSGALMEAGNLESLPNTRREVRAISSLFGRLNSTVLLGDDATESNFKRRDLSRYSVIHLATHGILDSESSARSGLVFGTDGAAEDGILQVREVYRLPLRASLVTLSACQSALGRLLTGEGMVGLARAFAYAGAESIVASLWNVNDEASAEFMSRFYGYLKAGASKEEALRQAKLSMSAEPRYRHPYYWAPYILIGDGAGVVAFPRDWTVALAVAGLVALAAAALFYRRARNHRVNSNTTHPDSSRT